MTSDPRVAEAESAFLRAAEREHGAREVAGAARFAALADAVDADVQERWRCAGIVAFEASRSASRAYRALQSARAGKEAGRGE